jgi:hypothetical protein
MQLTEEEKTELFLEFQQRFLLTMPDIIGNLINQHMSNYRLKEGLYSKHPEFKKYPQLVAAGVLKTEGSNTLLSQEEIVERAIPTIKQLIAESEKLNKDKIDKRPDLSTHGEL